MISKEICLNWMVDQSKAADCFLLWHKCPEGATGLGSYRWARYIKGSWQCPKCGVRAPQEITDFCLLSGIAHPQNVRDV